MWLHLERFNKNTNFHNDIIIMFHNSSWAIFIVSVAQTVIKIEAINVELILETS